MNSWLRSACYPRRTFYPLSDGPSMWNHRITKACFRTCSTCRSRSQPGLCLYARRLISKQPEPSIARLRYNLGGDRPSQTARLTGSLPRMTGVGESHGTIRVVFHWRLPPSQNPGFQASYLCYADRSIAHC
jgi:hypothetical protein